MRIQVFAVGQIPDKYMNMRKSNSNLLIEKKCKINKCQVWNVFHECGVEGRLLNATGVAYK